MTNEQVGGYRSLPHTADVRLEAWGPSREECLEQAVAGLVSTFADMAGAQPVGTIAFERPDGPGEDLLVAVLDEVIYRLDTESVLPLRSDVQRTDSGVRVTFEVVSAADAELIGAVPKAASLHGLAFERGPSGWRCRVTVDI